MPMKVRLYAELLRVSRRVNGLITPWRPMSLEAAAGKNPVSHVGKIYNILAKRLAETLVTVVPEVIEAHCLNASQIGML